VVLRLVMRTGNRDEGVRLNQPRIKPLSILISSVVRYGLITRVSLTRLSHAPEVSFGLSDGERLDVTSCVLLFFSAANVPYASKNGNIPSVTSAA
jgi:hypothetical protein